MAKLVGTYKFVVGGTFAGKNAKGNDVVKLDLKFTDERLNDQDVPLQAEPMVPWHGSLKREKGKSGKSPAEITAETLHRAFKFKGGLDDLHNLMFAQGYAICADHDDGNFTRITSLISLEGIGKNHGQALQEFSDDVKSDLDSIFKQVTSR